MTVFILPALKAPRNAWLLSPGALSLDNHRAIRVDWPIPLPSQRHSRKLWVRPPSPHRHFKDATLREQHPAAIRDRPLTSTPASAASSTPTPSRAARRAPAMRASGAVCSARRALVSKTAPSEVMIAIVPAMAVPANDDVSAIVRAVVTVVGSGITGGNIGARIGSAATKEQTNRCAHAQENRSRAGYAPQQSARAARAERRLVNVYQCGLGFHFQNFSSVPGINSGQALEWCSRQPAFRCPRKPSRKFHWD